MYTWKKKLPTNCDKPREMQQHETNQTTHEHFNFAKVETSYLEHISLSYWGAKIKK